jgi:hypothetical protein
VSVSNQSPRSAVFGEVRVGLAAFSLVWGSAIAILVTISIFVLVGYPALLLFEDTGLLRRDTIIGMSGVVALLTGVTTCLPGIMQWAGGYRILLDSQQLMVEHVFGRQSFDLRRFDWIAEYVASDREHGLCLSHDGKIFVLADACLTPCAQDALRAELRRLCAVRGLPFEVFDYVPRSSSFHPLRAFHAGAFDLFGCAPQPGCDGAIVRPSLAP